MSIDLNIPGAEGSNSNYSTSKAKSILKIPELNEFQIAELFASIGSDKRQVVVPVGFPGAGKSLLFSSLLWYGKKCTDAQFRILVRGDKAADKEDNDIYFLNGQIVVDNMVQDFHDKKLYGRTTTGTLDLIGVDIIPSKASSDPKKFPILKMAFLDLAGEDLKKIKVSEGGEFNTKINSVFKGLEIEDSELIFLLITPFDPIPIENETKKNAHNREDTLHSDFLNFVEANRPQLFARSKFVVIVSQWDKNNSYASAEAFLEEKRPSIYQMLKNSGRAVWGQYSVGSILESEVDGGVVMQKIHKQNVEYPSRLWKKIYHLCTGKSLDQKNFWEKIFG